MYIYLTAGTLEYLTKVAESHSDEKIVKMVNEDSALLLHETDGESVFKEPRKYTVLDSSGTIGNIGFAALLNIPVTDEGRPLFEYQFKDKIKPIKDEIGFVAIRVLRPMSSQTYVILTVWENEHSFQSWKASSSFQAGLNLNYEADPKQNTFASAPYVKTYSITE
ncbi:antibiotic biosynthesis monooxygenase family protein [Bacillota bacterium Lsc_1132]